VAHVRAECAAMSEPIRDQPGALRPHPHARATGVGGLLCLALLGVVAPAGAVEAGAGLKPCRLPAVETEALCGSVRRALDPARPAGPAIDVHFAVLPALAPNKRPDPVFFFAGGPGQSAIDLAGSVSRLLGRVSNRRDIVLIDQRGTGRSAPLKCSEESPMRPLREQVDTARQQAELAACLRQLQALPHGDLRHYTTWVAMQDADAVRQALGATRIDLVGVSYGTRAALDYQRQFPANVRRAVLDGVAPPDMALPASSSTDNQAALDALWAACEADAACRRRFPALRGSWQRLLDSLPRKAVVAHPMTGQPETLSFTREMVLGLVRQPLYAPTLASALPLAVSEAADGRFGALVGLGTALGSGRRGQGLAAGMHFSVVCAEDLPGVPAATDRPGADFGDSFAGLYQRVCADWPRGAVPPAFYTLPPAPAATLLLSGAIDPATPPRHADRVARALGAKALHVVVPNAGHGVMGIGCVRDVVTRFIDAEDDPAALKVDAACAASIPRPPAYQPPVAKAAP